MTLNVKIEAPHGYESFRYEADADAIHILNPTQEGLMKVSVNGAIELIFPANKLIYAHFGNSKTTKDSAP
jgi:hypothetical protein